MCTIRAPYVNWFDYYFTAYTCAAYVWCELMNDKSAFWQHVFDIYHLQWISNILLKLKSLSHVFHHVSGWDQCHICNFAKFVNHVCWQFQILAVHKLNLDKEEKERTSFFSTIRGNFSIWMLLFEFRCFLFIMNRLSNYHF